MNKLILWIGAGIVILIALGVVWALSMNSGTSTEPSPPGNGAPNGDSSAQLSNTAACATADADTRRIVEAPFGETDTGAFAGEVEVSGSIATEERTIFGETVTAVYLVVPESSAVFYQHFSERVESGNTVNALSEGALYFKLGTIENGELMTTAAFSERAAAEVMEALQAGGSVSLELSVPVFFGTEAPPEFSFACAVRSA